MDEQLLHLRIAFTWGLFGLAAVGWLGVLILAFKRRGQGRGRHVIRFGPLNIDSTSAHVALVALGVIALVLAIAVMPKGYRRGSDSFEISQIAPVHHGAGPPSTSSSRTTMPSFPWDI